MKRASGQYIKASIMAGYSSSSCSEGHIGDPYRMKRTVIVGTVLLVALIRVHQQVESKPTSIDTSEFTQQHHHHLHQQHQHYDGFQMSDEQRSSLGFQQNDPIRAIHYHFDQKMDPFMQLHRLNFTPSPSSSINTNGHDELDSNTVTCNDGSPIGYYKRLNSHSKSWIIYLQGGGFCASEEACQQRLRHNPQLMSSNHWPTLKSVDGILSSDPKDNPYLWNANHIYVPYCSSDVWTGLRAATGQPNSSSFAFMGSRIIEKVLDSLFDDLPRESSLIESKFVLLAGDSAGGIGVVMNLDKVNRLIQQRFNDSSASACHSQDGTTTTMNCEPSFAPRQAPVIRGLADSAWFLDNEPYDYAPSFPHEWSTFGGQQHESGSTPEAADCDQQRCTPSQSTRQAMAHWNGQVPKACGVRESNEPWRCYFAYRTYQTLETPLFVVQWLYDEAQLLVDNIIRPTTVDQWAYVNRLVNDLRQSLENVTALFVPSCFAHSLIVKQSWNQININGFRLPHVLNSWEEEVLSNQPTLESLAALDHHPASPALRNEQSAINQAEDRQLQQTPTGALFDIELRTILPRLSANHAGQAAASANVNQMSTNLRPKGRKKRRNNANSGPSSGQYATNNIRPTGITNRLGRSTSLLDDTASLLGNSVPDILIASISKQQEGAEKFRLIDTCGWPQCNRDCPNLDRDLNLRPILAY